MKLIFAEMEFLNEGKGRKRRHRSTKMKWNVSDPNKFENFFRQLYLHFRRFTSTDFYRDVNQGLTS